MSEVRESTSSDSDMRGSLAALRRAAQRAREIAWLTGTPLIIERDGQIVEEWIEEEPETLWEARKRKVIPDPK